MANPNPSPATRFGAGQATNNGGKTSEQKRLDYETAEMAARIRHKMVSGIMEKLSAGTEVLELLSGDALRLLKDSEDRAHGTPKQSVDVDANVRGTIATSPVSPEQWAARHADGE